jgi:hypothetical protein
MRVSLKKVEIALEQLHCAIELFLADRFIPAITLAGAAEEIFGKAISLRGYRNSLDIVVLFVLSNGRAAGRAEKQIRDACNRVKNCLKHGAQGTIEFNPQLDAYLLIARSIENYLRLGKPKSELMRQFEEVTRNVG